MYNFNKDIIWVFSLENPERSPSNFSGGILPASYLEISKLVFLKSSKANEILQKFRPKFRLSIRPFGTLVSIFKIKRPYNFVNTGPF